MRTIVRNAISFKICIKSRTEVPTPVCRWSRDGVNDEILTFGVGACDFAGGRINGDGALWEGSVGDIFGTDDGGPGGLEENVWAIGVGKREA